MTSKMLVGVPYVPFDNPIIVSIDVYSTKDIQEIKKFCSENVKASWGFSNSVHLDWASKQQKVYFCFSEESDFMVLKLFCKYDNKRIYLWPSSLSFTFKLYGEHAEKIQ